MYFQYVSDKITKIGYAYETHGSPPYARRILAASPFTLRSKYVNLMSAMARLVTVTMF